MEPVKIKNSIFRNAADISDFNKTIETKLNNLKQIKQNNKWQQATI